MDDLGPLGARLGPDPLEDLEQRAAPPVQQVHRNLRQRPPAFRIPRRNADGAERREAASGGPHPPGDAARRLDIVGGEVLVEGDERFAGAHRDRSRGRMQTARAAVGKGLAPRQPRRETAAAAPPDLRQRLAVRGGASVEEDRNARRPCDLLAERTGEPDRILHHRARQGDDREHIERPGSGVPAPVPPEVNPGERRLDQAQRGAADLSGAPGEGEDGAVVGGIRVGVEEDRSGGAPKLPDRLRRASLAEVRDRFEERRRPRRAGCSTGGGAGIPSPRHRRRLSIVAAFRPVFRRISLDCPPRRRASVSPDETGKGRGAARSAGGGGRTGRAGVSSGDRVSGDPAAPVGGEPVRGEPGHGKEKTPPGSEASDGESPAAESPVAPDPVRATRERVERALGRTVFETRSGAAADKPPGRARPGRGTAGSGREHWSRTVEGRVAEPEREPAAGPADRGETKPAAASARPDPAAVRERVERSLREAVDRREESSAPTAPARSSGPSETARAGSSRGGAGAVPGGAGSSPRGAGSFPGGGGPEREGGPGADTAAPAAERESGWEPPWAPGPEAGADPSRPSARRGGGRLAEMLATCGYLGRIPPAPGTLGAAAGLGVFLLTRSLPGWLQLLYLLAAILLGTWAAARHARALGEKDPGSVVVDEFAGMWLALVGTDPSLTLALLAFVGFRVLDIFKPPPVRQSERLPGGIGIMADDLLAGGIVRAAIFLVTGQ